MRAGHLKILPIILLLATLSFGFAWGAAAKAIKANALFATGKLDEALKAYTDAQLDSPESPELHFDIGNVLYRQGKYKEARTSFQKALASDDVKLQAKAFYNIGNSYFKEGNLPESIMGYKESLRRVPTDQDAKHNLELARKLLKQKQEQQQQEQQQQQQQKKENQEQQTQENQKKDQENQQEQQQQEQQKKPEDQQKQEQQEKQEQMQEGQEQQQQEQNQPDTEGEKQEMSQEQAERILQSLSNEEMEEQKNQMMMPSSGESAPEKDW